MPEMMKRVQLVAAYRRASSRVTTQRLADAPTVFGEIRQPMSTTRRMEFLFGLHEKITAQLIPTVRRRKLHRYGRFS